MNIRLMLLAAVVGCTSSNAQITWPVTNLPAQAGDYYRAYLSENQNLSALIGTAGGPQVWDLSASQQPDEAIRRVDIVAPTDGGQGSSFPGASYAERDTDEPSSVIARRYYSITTSGRLYHGFYNPVDDPASPTVVFNDPTLEWPATVQFGQSWTRNVQWTDTILTFPVIFDFNADVVVDAHGTLMLPNLGAREALRVKAVHVTDTYLLGDTVPFISQTNTLYYWLVEELGIGAEIVTFANSSSRTNLLLRIFESSQSVTPEMPVPVSGLHINVQGGSALLSWDSMTNASSYEVESIGSLPGTNWWLSGSPITNEWLELLTSTQRFYRVFGIP